MKRTVKALCKFSDLSHLFITAALLLITFGSTAQVSSVSTVTLRTGLVIKGEVITLVPDDYIEIKTPMGTNMKIEWKDIQSLDFSSSPSYAPKTKKDYDFSDSSYYFTLAGGFPFGLDQDGYPSVGFSSSVSLGKSINKKMHVGIVTGYDFYWWPNTGIIPLGVEFRGRFHEKGFSPYYYVHTGYGFAGYSELENGWKMGETTGGIFIAPGLGLTAKHKPHSAWFLQLGLKMQKTKSSYWETIWDNTGGTDAFIEDAITFRRFDLKFGFFFD